MKSSSWARALPSRVRAFALVAVLAAVAISAGAAVAQEPDTTGVIRGMVIGGTTRDSIAKATISVNRRQRATTDNSGRFTVREVPPGRVTVRARAFGYRDLERVVTVPRGGAIDVVFELEAVAVVLRPVRTSADRPVERDRFELSPDVGSFVISRDALSSVPAVGEADVLRTVQLLPGVLARNDFDAGYNVRGGESDQNLVLLDGIPVYNPFHLGGLFGTFIDDAVQRVDLLSGGFGAAYGGRLSSVLDVTSAEQTQSGVHGAVGVSLLAATTVLGGATSGGRGSWNVAARRTYADALSRYVTDERLPYHFRDAQLHAAHLLPGGGKIALTAYHGLDVLTGDFLSSSDSSRLRGGDVHFDWGNNLAGLTYTQPVRKLLGDSATLLQRVSVSRFATKLDLGSGTLVLENAVSDYRLGGGVTWHGSRHAPSVGYEVVQHQVRYTLDSDQITARLFSLSQSPVAGALYAEDIWKVGPLIVRPGVRLEHVSDVEWSGVSPRLALKYFITPDMAISVAGGQYAQWMHAIRNEDLPIRIFDFWVASDKYVPVSRATDAVLGAESWLSPLRFVRAEAYWKNYDNITEADSADDPVVRGDEFRPVEGHSYGLELLARQLDAGRLSGWIAYSFAVSRRSKGGDSYAPAQDRRHNLNVVATYRTASRYQISARFGLGTGTPYTPIESQIVRRDYDPLGNSWGPASEDPDVEPVAGGRNSTRYPSYHRLDLSVSRPFVKRRAVITPFLQLVNAYNRRNVFIYSFDYEASPPTSKAISQFPILPSIGVTVEF